MKKLFEKYCPVLGLVVYVYEWSNKRRALYICEEAEDDEVYGLHTVTKAYFSYIIVAAEVLKILGAKRILSAGCGLGGVHTIMKQVLPEARVDFVDLSPTVIEALELFGEGDVKNSRFFVQDINSINFEEMAKEYDTLYVDCYIEDWLAIEDSKIKEAGKYFKNIVANCIKSSENYSKVIKANPNNYIFLKEPKKSEFEKHISKFYPEIKRITSTMTTNVTGVAGDGVSKIREALNSPEKHPSFSVIREFIV